MSGGGSSSPHVTIDLKQDYDAALAKCRAAAAEANEENAVKRRKNIQGIVVVVFLCLIVVLGIRKVLKPKSVHSIQRREIAASADSVKVEEKIPEIVQESHPVERIKEDQPKPIAETATESSSGSAHVDPA